MGAHDEKPPLSRREFLDLTVSGTIPDGLSDLGGGGDFLDAKVEVERA